MPLASILHATCAHSACHLRPFCMPPLALHATCIHSACHRRRRSERRKHSPEAYQPILCPGHLAYYRHPRSATAQQLTVSASSWKGHGLAVRALARATAHLDPSGVITDGSLKRTAGAPLAPRWRPRTAAQACQQRLAASGAQASQQHPATSGRRLLSSAPPRPGMMTCRPERASKGTTKVSPIVILELQPSWRSSGR